jgi:hypothetical protein
MQNTTTAIDWPTQIELSTDFARDMLIKHGEPWPMFVVPPECVKVATTFPMFVRPRLAQ